MRMIVEDFRTLADLFHGEVLSQFGTTVHVPCTVLEHAARSHDAAHACALCTGRALLGTRSRSTMCVAHSFERFPAIQGASLFGWCQCCTSGVSGRLRCEIVFVVLRSVTVLTSVVTDAQHGACITRREPHRPHMGTPRVAHTRTGRVKRLRLTPVRKMV